MRKWCSRSFVLLSVAAFTAACSDSPTGNNRIDPSARGQELGACYDGNSDGSCGDGSGYGGGYGGDYEKRKYPSEDDGGGQCMSSFDSSDPAMQGCTGGGGNPGGDGAPETSLENDMARDTLPPTDCYAPDLSHWEELYCFRRTQPDSSQLRKTRQALDNIAARGGACLLVAQTGRELLAAGQITFYVAQEGDTGGYGHRNTGIQLDAAYAQWYDHPDSGYEKALVHEIDHVLGFDHIDAAKLETPHSVQCG